MASKRGETAPLGGKRKRKPNWMRAARAELVQHVGGAPTAPQKVLIERALQLQARVRTMDKRFLQAGEMTEHDSRTYLAWSNALTRLLRELGMRPAAEKAPTLAQILAGIAPHAPAAAVMPPPAGLEA